MCRICTLKYFNSGLTKINACWWEPTDLILDPEGLFSLNKADGYSEVTSDPQRCKGVESTSPVQTHLTTAKASPHLSRLWQLYYTFPAVVDRPVKRGMSALIYSLPGTDWWRNLNLISVRTSLREGAVPMIIISQPVNSHSGHVKFFSVFLSLACGLTVGM